MTTLLFRKNFSLHIFGRHVADATLKEFVILLSLVVTLNDKFWPWKPPLVCQFCPQLRFICIQQMFEPFSLTSKQSISAEARILYITASHKIYKKFKPTIAAKVIGRTKTFIKALGKL